MTKISRFTKHTGFTSVKQLAGDRLRLDCVGGRRQSGYRYSKVFSVPEGKYFENVMISCSLVPGVASAGNTAVYELGGNTYRAIVAQVFQKNNSQYEVSALVSADFGQTVDVPSFTLEVRLNLSLAPF